MSLSNEINSSKLGIDNQSTIPISVIGPTSTYASLANVSYELGRYGQTDASIISATRFVGDVFKGSLELGGPDRGLVYVDSIGQAKVSTNVFSKYGGLYITGNLSVLGDFNVVGSNNVIITDPIFEIASNVADGDDRGFIMQRPSGNVLIGHIGSSDELVFSYTDSSSHGTTIVPDTSKQINVSILGNLFVSNVISGDGSNISNTNDVYSGTYGNGSFVPQITFTGGRISGVTNVPVSGSVGVQNFQQTTDIGNTTSNVILFENPTTAFVTTGNVLVGSGLLLANSEANTIVATNNISANYYHGNAWHLTDTTNVADGVYGSASSIPRITVREGRVDLIEGQSITLDKTLQEVTEQGNTTTEVVHFNNSTTGFTTVANVSVGGNLGVSGLISGDGGEISNVVDVSDGTYGGELGNIAKIEVTNGRITHISNISVELDKSLQDVTSYGNSTTDVVQFINPGTALVTTGNVIVGVDLLLANSEANTIVATNNISAGYYHGNAWHLTSTTNVADGVYGSTSSIPQITVRDGRVDIIEGQSITLDKTLQEVTEQGNTTTEVVQFNNSTTAFTTVANVVIGGNLDISGVISGDGGELSNIVDVSDGTYGGELGNIAKIVVTGGRITEISNVSVELDKSLQDVTEYGNSTTEVVQFNNSTTALTTVANVVIGGNLDVSGVVSGDGGQLSNMVDAPDGTYGGELGNIAKFEIVNGRITGVSNVHVELDKSLQDVTDYGNATTQVTSFTNTDISLTTGGNVIIGGSVHFIEDVKLFGRYANISVGNSISLGSLSGHVNQSANSIAIGNYAGRSNQNEAAIALGMESGFVNQGSRSVAIGYQAGNDGQGSSSISIGESAGLTSQKVGAVAVGYHSGYIDQGSHSIAIGTQSGVTSQNDNTIILNATGTVLNTVNTDGLYVAPIRASTSQFANVMASNIISKEVITSVIAIENSNVGISNSNPGHTLAIGSNAYFDDDGSNIFVISGNISCTQLSGNVTVTELTFGGGSGATVQSVSLQDICEVGNTYNNTIRPQNVSVSGFYYGNAAFVKNTTNVAPGTYGSSTEIPVITIDSNARIDSIVLQSIPVESDTLAQVVNRGNTTANTVIFETATTALVTDGRVGVANTNPQHALVIGAGGDIYMDGNVSVTTNGTTVSIGNLSGVTDQKSYAIAIGNNAGATTQGSNSVAVGYNAGETIQGPESTSIGYISGQSNQGSHTVAVGRAAGRFTQGSGSVAIGYNASQTSQGTAAVAVGFASGQTSQGRNAIAVGNGAGAQTQGSDSVAIGYEAGNDTQGIWSVSIGLNAGRTLQDSESVAIGRLAGECNQSCQSVAIGRLAGRFTQGVGSVAMGQQAGTSVQGDTAIAIGFGAGQSTQGNNAIAIGNRAGQTNQHNNTIVLNASGSAVNSTGTSRTFINPVRSTTSTRTVYWNSSTSELTASSTKSFMIQHPISPDKYLIHSCLEGPEQGIFYRGRVVLQGGGNTSNTVTLPTYVSHIIDTSVYETICVSRIRDPSGGGPAGSAEVSVYDIDTNSFTVYGTAGTYNWTFFAQRLHVQDDDAPYQGFLVEPDKSLFE